MKCILKNVTIADPNSPQNGKKRDILIEGGKISKIKSSIPSSGKIKEINYKNLHVSPGWFDMSSHFCDPGEEYREDLYSGMDAAAKGGFTGCLVMPSTYPPISTKSQVEYILKKSDPHIVDLEVSASLSSNLEGKQISEYGDLVDAGAKAFTDYKKPVNVSELMIRALDYSINFDTLIISFPYDDGIAPEGLMNEGAVSVSLGIKGLPSISEEVRLQRDIEFLKYTGGRMHVSMISTKTSVDLIKEAKKQGVNITCGIAAHQLSFTDWDMVEFDTRLKVLPPFRSKEDKKALIKGLKDGIIDVVCSDHNPIDIDHKKIEFEYAEFGISGIETAFSAFYKEAGKKMDMDGIIEKFSINPRKILNIDVPKIKEGENANLTLFSLEDQHTFSTEDMISKSQNNPFGKTEFDSKVIGIVNNDKITINS